MGLDQHFNDFPGDSVGSNLPTGFFAQTIPPFRDLVYLADGLIKTPTGTLPILKTQFPLTFGFFKDQGRAKRIKFQSVYQRKVPMTREQNNFTVDEYKGCLPKGWAKTTFEKLTRMGSISRFVLIIRINNSVRFHILEQFKLDFGKANIFFKKIKL